jgi:two-component system, LuxR family, response regulator FixJ
MGLPAASFWKKVAADRLRNATRVPTVYLIEDDEAVLNALRFALELEGMAVRPYLNAEALLADFDSLDAGCLVVDHFMPGLTGLELLKLLRSRGCRLPAILITTRADDAMRRRALKLGVDHVLEKPLSDSALVEFTRQALATA